MKRLRGFTIIELLVVLTVIAILVGVAYPRIKGMQDEANTSKAKSELRVLQAAVESYYIHQDPSAYPSTTVTLCSTYLNNATPQIVGEVLYDPFSGSAGELDEYGYYLSDNNRFYVIYSVGADGTADIIGIEDTGSLEGELEDDIFVTNGAGS